MNTQQLYLFIGALIFSIFPLTALIRVLTGFPQELKRVNNEIKRSTERSRSYWLRRRRRLWLSLLPFVKY